MHTWTKTTLLVWYWLLTFAALWSCGWATYFGLTDQMGLAVTFLGIAFLGFGCAYDVDMAHARKKRIDRFRFARCWWVNLRLGARVCEAIDELKADLARVVKNGSPAHLETRALLLLAIDAKNKLEADWIGMNLWESPEGRARYLERYLPIYRDYGLYAEFITQGEQAGDRILFPWEMDGVSVDEWLANHRAVDAIV